jgi:hypothetical protein
MSHFTEQNNYYLLCLKKDDRRFDPIMLITFEQMRISRWSKDKKQVLYRILLSMNTLKDLTCQEPIEINTFCANILPPTKPHLLCLS